MSLQAMVNPLSKMVRRTLVGHEFLWRAVYSQEDIQKIHNNREYESVEVKSDECSLGYQSDVKEMHEAWLYPEGDILMCATVSEFAGTFASHDEISVKYFHLVPNPNWKKMEKNWWRQYDVMTY